MHVSAGYGPILISVKEGQTVRHDFNIQTQVYKLADGECDARCSRRLQCLFVSADDSTTFTPFSVEMIRQMLGSHQLMFISSLFPLGSHLSTRVLFQSVWLQNNYTHDLSC